ncbi:MAG: hypothetical protein EOQ94_20890 [Mesorhizobium sp.]|uniref:hypothetical protein n=1 Tax=Mesorhizobium sp. TaxID=1871066 RepID=UPI000FE6FD3E|nr:hypothetical protein [Mesorhizobium sp.]RWI19453.1 MAG: hypothetical protein EOQ94_20890 [Mesorhizobium sp.]
MARPATAAVRLLTGEREPVRLATIANITLYGLQTIDGVAAEVGDRVLVKDQADQTENGIYTASEGRWFRAADARSARTMQKGTTVHVQEGAVSADRVYAFETLDPVIGADPITLSFYLSQDTLGDAVDAADAAAASAAAALTSKNAAATSATSAAGSATAASGSATAASTSATSAATSATNAGNSATAAAGSASAASGSATSAGTSASAAAGSATAASGSASAAASSATNATTSATNAAASAAAAANAVAALGYTFSTSTADADPGNGTLRLNNASAASATAAYIDNLDSSGATVSGILDTFDDSTKPIKGQLSLRSKASAAIAYVYSVTGSVVDGGGYRKLTLAYVSGAGTLPTTADGIWLTFTRAGDKGADGLGSGDFSGPASSVTDNIVTFAGTTGKAGKDSGVAVASLVAGPASAATDNIATFNGGTGKVVKDSGVAVSGLAPKASPTFTGTPTAPTAAAGTNSTQIATTAYVDTTFAPKASPTFTGTPAAPTAAPGTNTTQIATTGFVKAAIDVVLGGVSAAFDTLAEIAAAMVQKAVDNTGIAAGFTSTAVNDGTKSSGTYTPWPSGGNMRYITNGGAFTLAAPTQVGDYSMIIQIVNGATAGAITFSGFALSPGGNSLTTANGSRFNLYITKLNGTVTGSVEAQQ